MKTKIKYAALAAVTLLTGFTSCSNDEDGGKPDNSAPKSMFLKISSDTPSTYSEGSVQGAAAVTFTVGDLYFTTTNGTIKKHYTITTAATDATNINMATLTGAGETIRDLPGDITDVYVVGNTTGLPVTGNISEVKTKALPVQSQGTITNVNLYGEATLPSMPTVPGVPGTSNDLYKVSITLAPTVARIELTDITASGAITGFEVAGIFVDNYYSQADVNGSVLAANLKDNGASAAPFSDNTSEYPTALKTFVYDWYNPGLAAAGNPLVAKPATAGHIWGYNLFATATGSTVPRIVIRLINVTATPASGLTFTGAQFITIKGFKKGSTALTAIKACEVYNIGAGLLSFDEQDLSETPNLKTIDVEVKVTLADWVPVSVTPEL